MQPGKIMGGFSTAFSYEESKGLRGAGFGLPTGAFPCPYTPAPRRDNAFVPRSSAAGAGKQVTDRANNGRVRREVADSRNVTLLQKIK